MCYTNDTHKTLKIGQNDSCSKLISSEATVQQILLIWTVLHREDVRARVEYCSNVAYNGCLQNWCMKRHVRSLCRWTLKAEWIVVFVLMELINGRVKEKYNSVELRKMQQKRSNTKRLKTDLVKTCSSFHSLRSLCRRL